MTTGEGARVRLIHLVNATKGACRSGRPAYHVRHFSPSRRRHTQRARRADPPSMMVQGRSRDVDGRDWARERGMDR